MSWPSMRLAELSKVITKGTTPTTLGYNFSGEGVRFLRVQNIDGGSVNYERDTLFIDGRTHQALERSQIRPGDVLVSIAGTIGRSGVVPDNAPALNCNQAIAIVRTNGSVFQPFLRHWLESSDAQTQMRGATVTGTISNLSLTQVGNLRIPVPPLAEQRRIAEVLDRAEALRTKRRAALAQLDTLTQSIFFVLFGDPFSPISQWPRAKFGDVVEHLAYGPRFYNEAYSEDGVRIVRITDLDEAGHLDFSAMPRLTVDARDREKYALKEGDLLFARSGSVGKSTVFPTGAPLCIAGAYFIVMRFKRSVTPLFARSVLAAESVQRFIQKRSRQAIQPNFSGPALRSIPLPIVPLDLQREFARRVVAVEKLKTAHRASLAELDALFAVLQHCAFRGEL